MTSKRLGGFLLGLLCAGVNFAEAQTVQLGISRGGGTVILSWPVTATNGVLQSTTDLSSTNWVAVSNVVAGALSNSVTVTNTSSVGFFRLYVNTNFLTPPGMSLVPAGSFAMGDTTDNNEFGDAAPLTVDVSAFYMDQADVTFAQWQSVCDWAVGHGYSFDDAGAGKDTNYPVELVSWYDSVKWCNARSEMEGRTPAYYTSAAHTTVYRTGDLNLSNSFVNWQGGYRLPTEAEWEKAARGGLSEQRFPWGDTINESQANYNGDPSGYDMGPAGFNATFATGGYPYTSPAGSFAANGYGLYDMAGDVWQWCWDLYATTYAGGTDPHGPTTGNFRTYRGGGWGNVAAICRCATRNDETADFTYYALGFRCVLP